MMICKPEIFMRSHPFGAAIARLAHIGRAMAGSKGWRFILLVGRSELRPCSVSFFPSFHHGEQSIWFGAMDKARRDNLLKALLDWHALAGVDALLEEGPRNRFMTTQSANALEGSGEAAGRAARASTPAPASAPAPAPAPGSAPISPSQPPVPPPAGIASPAAAVAMAREAAMAARDMKELQEAVEGFDGCALKRMARKTCFGDGNPKAPLMFIGEAPGRDEDMAGLPFVGRAGQLLDRMLKAAGWGRQEEAWITNIVYWRPPGNRTPNLEETEICRPFLERRIELVEPQIIIALGGAAAKTLLATRSGIMRLRGKWRELEAAGRAIPLMPTFHPAFLLRNPAAKALAWRDLLETRKRLEEG
jgi:DNA polymerase